MSLTSLRIRCDNDAFRHGMNDNGKWVLSQGVSALPEHALAIIAKVRAFHAFEDGDDAHGAHDFGTFEHAGRRLLWKIDVMDPTYRRASEDATDPKKTRRLLTVMLAEEY